MLGSNFQTFLFATISFQFPGKCFSALSGVAQVFADFLHPLEICLAATEINFKFCPRNFQLSGKSWDSYHQVNLSSGNWTAWSGEVITHWLKQLCIVQLYIFCKRSPHICRSRFCVGNVPAHLIEWELGASREESAGQKGIFSISHFIPANRCGNPQRRGGNSVQRGPIRVVERWPELYIFLWQINSHPVPSVTRDIINHRPVWSRLKPPSANHLNIQRAKNRSAK